VCCVCEPETLKTAASLVGGDRQASHGDPRDTHQRIAMLWSAYLGAKGTYVLLTAQDAAMMMSLMKMARAIGNPAHDDSYVDAAAYIGIAAECSGR
jgi:hypothetical protein